MDRDSVVYVLHNPVRHQIVLPKRDFNFDWLEILHANQRLVQKIIELPFGPEQFTLTPTLDDAWLSESKLVRLERVAVGRLTKHLEVEGFKLGSPNPGTGLAGADGDATVPLTNSRNLANTRSLEHLKLSEHPTKEEIKDYVESILLLSQHRRELRPDDPQIEMLQRVGSDNVDVLFAAQEHLNPGPADFYVSSAIARLARPEDKAAILAALPKHHGLIGAVLKHGWKTEARDTLLAGLRDSQQRNLPPLWIRAVVSLGDPDTYSDLTNYLARCRNRYQTLVAIEKLPGVDLGPAVDAAWKSAQHGLPFELLDGCAMAAEFGHADALEKLVNILKQDNNDLDVKRAAALFKRFTSTTGSPSELIDWYEKNRGRIKFDSARKKYLTPKDDA